MLFWVAKFKFRLPAALFFKFQRLYFSDFPMDSGSDSHPYRQKVSTFCKGICEGKLLVSVWSKCRCCFGLPNSNSESQRLYFSNSNALWRRRRRRRRRRSRQRRRHRRCWRRRRRRRCRRRQRHRRLGETSLEQIWPPKVTSKRRSP